MKTLITGGAGFIGSHLTEALVKQGWNITILDNLTTGERGNLTTLINGVDNVKLQVGDCTNPLDVRGALKDVDTVFHIAANPEVRLELSNPSTCFKQNIYATHILLEELKKCKANSIIFTSTSTVYGDAKTIPTPEDYSPLEPISIYGASKLASEALITSYCHTFNKRAIFLRLANIVGSRSRHGVINDFIAKLKKNPSELEVLGDRTQTKSYLHTDDCTSAILQAYEGSTNQVEVHNIGSKDHINVRKIAKIVANEMDLSNINFNFTGGVDGGRGWIGDVKNMLLDIRKLQSLEWKPQYNSEEAVRLTVRSILKVED